MLRPFTSTVLLLALCGLPATAGPVTLLSRADPDRPSSTPGGASAVVGISADGRYVAFLSEADNLVPGVTDTNLAGDLFFQDRIAGTTVLVSHTADDPSSAGNDVSALATLSADGRWLAYLSSATDLVAGQVDVAATADVFLWDQLTGVTALVSHRVGLPATAVGADGGIGISADGSRILFASSAPDLMAGQSDNGSSLDVFLYERATGANTLVSHISGDSTIAAGHSWGSRLSADGNRVVFTSWSPSIVGGQIDPNGQGDVFLYDRETDSSLLVSHAVGAATTTANGISYVTGLSADGSRIAYESSSTNLVAGQVDGNDDSDIFLYDRATGASTLVSHSRFSATTAANSYSTDSILSADGRSVAYQSQATDLVAEDTGHQWGVFFFDHAAGTNTLVSRGTTTPDNNSDGVPRLSSDGGWIAFVSSARNLVPGQTDTVNTWDVFLWSRVSGSITLVSRTPGSATTATGGWDPQISADGSWIAMSSSSSSLVSEGDDHNGFPDVYLYQRATGVISLLTLREGKVSASAGGFTPYYAGMSNDGRFIAFISSAGNLPVPGLSDANEAGDVFLVDRVTGAMTLVSHASDSPPTTASSGSFDPLVSADGSIAVFGSRATDLVPGQVASVENQLFLFARTTGEVTLVSHSAGSSSTPAEGGLGGRSAVSGDGRWIAFVHLGSDLVAGQVDGNRNDDVFLFDRMAGTSTLVSHTSSSPTATGNGGSSTPSISADGRWIAFTSRASDLVPGQDGAEGIFLYDRTTEALTRVISSNNGEISADGRWILFVSGDDNVVPGQLDTNHGSDIFLWDRVSGATLLVSRTPASPVATGNAMSDAPAFSADGRWVVFFSAATDLVAGQSGIAGALFLFDRIAGTVTLVSRSAASPTATGNGASYEPTISKDGRFVTYLSLATDLVPGQIDYNADSDLFLYDRVTGITSLVTHVPSSDVTSGRLGVDEGARLSADGAWAAFSSPSPDLVADDHDGAADAFLYANPIGRDLFTLSPCRILDTRLVGPALASGVKRTWVAPGVCGTPSTARAIAANVTVTQPTGPGYLTFHAGDLAPETTSTITFGPGQTRSSNAILPLAFDGTGAFAVTPFVAGNGTVHLIVDVSGYFE